MTTLDKIVLLSICLGIGSSATLLQEGDKFEAVCRMTKTNPDDVIRIYKNETRYKMFETNHTVERKELMNDTESLPYDGSFFRVTRNSNDQLVFTIDSVKDVDSGSYNCEKVTPGGEVTRPLDMWDLKVQGKLLDLYWTTDPGPFDPLVINPDVAEEDQATVEVLRGYTNGSNLYCIITVTTSEPLVNITYGSYESSSSTPAYWKKLGSYSHIDYDEGGFVSSIQSAERFHLLFSRLEQDYEDQPLFCRAELPSKTLEKSIVAMVYRKPPYNMRCEPYRHKALKGERNVSLTCTIRLFPLPTDLVLWKLGKIGKEVDNSSPIPGYTVITQVTGVNTMTSTLFIEEVKDIDFGLYSIKLINHLGIGEIGIFLDYDSVSGATCIAGSSLGLISMILGIIFL